MTTREQFEKQVIELACANSKEFRTAMRESIMSIYVDLQKSLGDCRYSRAKLERDLAALQERAERAEKELDEASPRQKCARCGVEFRWHQMVAEEGDEWECYPCNDRENDRERAALAQPQETGA